MEIILLIIVIYFIYAYRKRKKQRFIRRFPKVAFNPKNEQLPYETDQPVKVLIVDTESTGLEKKDQPISIGLILFEVSTPIGKKIREISSYYGLREPTVPINRQAYNVHGISKKDLKDKDFDYELIDKLIDEADILVAHNSKFDVRMLEPLFPQIVNCAWRCSVEQVDWPTKNKKLDTVCDHFQVQRPKTHNALDDCKALAEALFKHSGKTERSRTYMGYMIMSGRPKPSWQWRLLANGEKTY